ncbi:MAG: sensor histidine kinase [Chloroflexi bacterium]|nr:sensor histidine kinase [Chloroflexota bacterium]
MSSELQRVTAVSENDDFWVRSKWIWSAIFTLGYIAPLIILVFNRDVSSAEMVQATGFVIGVLVWHWAWNIWYPQQVARKYDLTMRDRQWQMSFYIAIVVVVWFLLIQIHPIFFMTLFGLYSQFYYLLHIRNAIIGTVLMTLVWYFANAQLQGSTISLFDPILWYVMIGVLIGGLFGLWINGIISESVSRRELVEQLKAAQAEQAVAEHRAGVLAERQRLAHEIHDTLAQGFVSIIMHLESAEPLLEGADATLLRHVSQANQAARENLKQVRRVVQELRPEPLERAALPEAIKYMVQKWNEQTEIETAVTITGNPMQLSAEAEVTLYRATQEALSNIRKHAQAKAVQITLSYMQDVIILDVQDDGVGISENNNSPSDHTSGYGITAMRERIAQFNGSVLLESEPDEGTTLVVSLPINRTE